MSVMLAAVECGSLSKASRKLGLPLATVSRKVSELESHLKADLLVRSAKGLDLTPAGRSYVAAVKTILEQLDEAERTAGGEYAEPKGDLVVTAPTMFGRLHLLPVVLSFLSAFPEVSVELMLTDRVTHFLDDHVDVALRIGDLPDSSLIATRLGAVRRVTCASPAYFARRAPPAVPQDLASHDVISFDSVAAQTTWRFGRRRARLRSPFNRGSASAPSMLQSTPDSPAPVSSAPCPTRSLISFERSACNLCSSPSSPRHGRFT